MAYAAYVTTKWRVTLPKALREKLDLKPGDSVSFSKLDDGTVVMRVEHRKQGQAGT
jgi:AbrB family looped-hinge helix DNA binding protein